MGTKQTGTDAKKEWAPTPKQTLLLEVLLDPFHRMATITRICELAQCSRDYYYACFRDPGFADFYREASIGLVKQRAGQMVNIGIREARKGGRDGFGYWREIMRMGQLTPDNKPLELSHSGELVIRFADPDDGDDEDDDDDA